MKLNRYKLLVGVAVILFTCCTSTPKSFEQRLKDIEGAEISILKTFDSTRFESAYEIMLEQPYDHWDKTKGNFKQRILVFNTGKASKPVVMETHGYNIWSDKATELSEILECNNITVEHRFFGDSRPDSIPWDLLTIKQSAADIHRVVTKFKELFTGKWISTGISKGGQTTIFHRALYPKDVSVSVPYVAPVNFEREDKRIHEFINNKVGSKEDRRKIKEFQLALFKNKKKLIPLLASHAKKRNYNFSIGLERALELNILEYSFAFWQWGNCSVEDIPTNYEDTQLLFDHLVKASSFSFFEDKSIEQQRPFFYQALTEMGMYSYEIAPFKKFLSDTTDICFDFTAPKGVEVNFRPQMLKKIKQFVETTNEPMLYIYGGYDAWTATSAVIDPKRKNSIKMILDKGDHGTRIRDFKGEQKEKILKNLEKWLELKINR